jgi:hypothetical protein
MNTTIENNEVAIINNSIEVFKTAPQILQASQLRSQKAVNAGNKILSQWQAAWQIEDDEERLAALEQVDFISNNYLVKCAAANTEEKEIRAAITQMMDMLRKMFTAAEALTDKTKEGTVPNIIQAKRNELAQERHRITELKRKAADLKAAKEKEAIDIRFMLENSYNNNFNNYLASYKQKLITGFNAITIDNFDDKKSKLHTLTFNFLMDVIATSASPKISYHNYDEYNKIEDSLKSELAKSFEDSFQAEMYLFRDELIEKLPSKYNELLEQKRIADEAEQARRQAAIAEAERQNKIAEATAEEKKRLEAQAEIEKQAEVERLAALQAQQAEAEEAKKQREEAEQAKILAEAEQAKILAAQQAEIKKQGDETMAMFEKEAAVAEVQSPAQTKLECEIEVKHAVGCGQIFTYWFENIGKDLPIDKILNTKIEQMKTWAEKQYSTKGGKIESKFLEYKNVVKAVSKKEKASK